MRTRNKFLAAAIGLGVAGLLGSTALAAPVRVDDASGGDGVFASAKLHQDVSIKVNNGNFQNQDSGVFGLIQSNASPNFPANTFSSLITYCIEIGQNLGQLPTTYQSQALATVVSPTASDAIRRLWAARFAESIDVNSNQFEGLSGIDSKERAAAFQVTIWELAVDGVSSTLDAGNFQVAQGNNNSQNDVYRLAQKYLIIAKDTNNTNLASIEALTEASKQDLLRPGGGPNGAQVPAPASLALFGAGLVALAAMRRKANV